ncbi:MAG: ATP-binding protein [Thermoguttaceae bacterium]|nr:ATP-binding protein [Clostridia bacterium]MBR5710974.1 ATP-binding protein [Thermoguttaceae bacterium]
MTNDNTVVIGKNILDNLTTGMYSDSRVIYREYIQNACDQIDIAKREGLLSEDNPGEISITIDSTNRNIIIEDNATGVKKKDFKENIYNIADSNKVRGQQRGFRGIGRLCGLAYCKTLKFTTSTHGENVASIMECDAQKMRQLLGDKKKYSVQEIWENIVKFDSKPEDIEKHYFKVELIDVIKEDNRLLDYDDISNYLSFVAPVPYKNMFFFSKQIYEHAKLINMPIDEYKIYINDNELFKGYQRYLYDNSGQDSYDEITNVRFKDFFDDSGKLIAWLWYGISRFEKNIPERNLMRGIRLRSANIQIGDNSTLRDFFRETRGNTYFIGELFAVDPQLIPNSQRDYFNENEARLKFENSVRIYFHETLYDIYRKANVIKNAYKAQEDYSNLQNDFDLKNQNQEFIDQQEKDNALQNLQAAKEKAEKESKKLQHIEDKSRDTPAIIEINNNYRKKFSSTSELPQKTDEQENQKKKSKYLPDKFSKLDRKERKILQKVMSIIVDTAPKDISNAIIERIKKEFG